MLIVFGLILYVVGAYSLILSRLGDMLAESETAGETRAALVTAAAAPVVVPFVWLRSAVAPAVSTYRAAREFWDCPRCR